MQEINFLSHSKKPIPAVWDKPASKPVSLAVHVITNPLDSNAPSAEWRLIIETQIGFQNENLNHLWCVSTRLLAQLPFLMRWKDAELWKLPRQGSLNE